MVCQPTDRGDHAIGDALLESRGNSSMEISATGGGKPAVNGVSEQPVRERVSVTPSRNDTAGNRIVTKVEQLRAPHSYNRLDQVQLHHLACDSSHFQHLPAVC